MLKGELDVSGPVDEVPKTVAGMLGVDATKYATSEELTRALVLKVFGTDGLSGNPASAAAAGPPAPPPVPKARWYWKEDHGNMSMHNPSDVLKAENFVSYAGSVCHELNLAHAAWTAGDGPVEVIVDLTDRIGSTGTEKKVRLVPYIHIAWGPMSDRSRPYDDHEASREKEHG